ncbi:Type 1 glutamine amidotransferase-like domain-containing protein [Clostridium sp. KNHs214]|uniref:Type 1 glutamine amidotransferase-like domain-containing protein n=1 Tax=Clostridium sp. KNHs214 TaxID=1540257 RepID=UPI00068F1540|nr:Type 1 glutamine amidotransferase-like domain-containing protein [Clostridium sp. KNHs214]
MLILSGGGDAEKVKPIDSFFANKINKEKVLIYIPVAMEEACFTYEECYNWFSKTYSEYGIYKIEMWTDLQEKKLSNEYAGVFIGGGNTYRLLKTLKDTKFDKECIKFLNNGGVIYGGSAGAIIFGKTIDSAKHADKNIVNLKDSKGLNFLNNKDVWCHYKETDDELIDYYNNELYILYEESGIIIDGKDVKEIGKKYKIKLL